MNFDPRALRFAADFAGAGQVLAGSDYPHAIGSIERMKASIADAGFSKEERAQIFGGNAEKIYRV